MGGLPPARPTTKILNLLDFIRQTGVARSLLMTGPVQRERRPVVSVTSEIASTLSFQSAQRAQKSDAPAGDSFASLVDSNTAAADNNSRSAEPPPSPANNPPAPRRPDDTAAANSGRPRENSAPDKPAKNRLHRPRHRCGRRGKRRGGSQARADAARQIEVRRVQNGRGQDERGQGGRDQVDVKNGFRRNARGRCCRDRAGRHG